jgi:hypothetical protein
MSLSDGVTTDDLAAARDEVTTALSLDGYTKGAPAAARRWRLLLAKRALREGMHPWTVANYSGLAESYVRSLVPASER